jgi:general secretion pathway protein K
VTNVGGWNGRTFQFPIDGGLIQARLEDGGNCFDLNSVVQGPPGSWTAYPVGVRQFEVLLQAIGVPAGEAVGLSRALVDWMDSDPSGDLAYAGRRYRTGGGLFAEGSELRAVQGVTPELYERLRPFVCALPRPDYPVSRLSPVNINTLREDQAPLATMLTDGNLPPAQARAWIAGRPAAGWRDRADFLSHPLLVERPPPPNPTIYLQIDNGMAGFPSRFFALHSTVGYGRAEVTMSSLLEHEKATGGIRLAARRWTAGE